MIRKMRKKASANMAIVVLLVSLGVVGSVFLSISAMKEEKQRELALQEKDVLITKNTVELTNASLMASFSLGLSQAVFESGQPDGSWKSAPSKQELDSELRKRLEPFLKPKNAFTVNDVYVSLQDIKLDELILEENKITAKISGRIKADGKNVKADVKTSWDILVNAPLEKERQIAECFASSKSQSCVPAGFSVTQASGVATVTHAYGNDEERHYYYDGEKFVEKEFSFSFKSG